MTGSSGPVPCVPALDVEARALQPLCRGRGGRRARGPLRLRPLRPHQHAARFALFGIRSRSSLFSRSPGSASWPCCSCRCGPTTCGARGTPRTMPGSSMSVERAPPAVPLVARPGRPPRGRVWYPVQASESVAVHSASGMTALALRSGRTIVAGSWTWPPSPCGSRSWVFAVGQAGCGSWSILTLRRSPSTTTCTRRRRVAPPRAALTTCPTSWSGSTTRRRASSSTRHRSSSVMLLFTLLPCPVYGPCRSPPRLGMSVHRPRIRGGRSSPSACGGQERW